MSVLTAMSRLLCRKDDFLQTLRANIATVVLQGDALSPEVIDERLNKLQKDLLKNLFFSHELSETELTASELLYLAQLYTKDGLTQEEMSGDLSVDKAATTRTIQAMEKKGLVRREVDSVDKRAKKVYLTEKAYEYETRIREIQKKWVDFITQDMTKDEADKFAGQLKQMAARAKEINA